MNLKLLCALVAASIAASIQAEEPARTYGNLSYPAKGNIHLDEGTVELHVTSGFDSEEEWKHTSSYGTLFDLVFPEENWHYVANFITWAHGTAMVSDGQNNVRLRKLLKIEKGKSYVLEAEAFVECDDGIYLGPVPELNYFWMALGEIYVNDKRTLTSQAVAGHTEKIRLWFTVNEYAYVDLWLRQAKGKAIVKKLEVYELKNPPRWPWEIGK